VAGTNGNLDVPLINKLSRYPIGCWPWRPAPAPGQSILDIGCGYLPIGVDIKIDALQAARRVMAFHNVAGFVVSADLAALPFQSGLLDSVFSYSVLQHAHRDKVRNCVAEIHRVLANDGACFLEFPLSHGLSNWRHSLKRSGI